jgi:hypothetical protein
VLFVNRLGGKWFETRSVSSSAHGACAVRRFVGPRPTRITEDCVFRTTSRHSACSACRRTTLVARLSHITRRSGGGRRTASERSGTSPNGTLVSADQKSNSRYRTNRYPHADHGLRRTRLPAARSPRRVRRGGDAKRWTKPAPREPSIRSGRGRPSQPTVLSTNAWRTRSAPQRDT